MALTHRQLWYQRQLKDPRWAELRLTILSRDNWECQSCKWHPDRFSMLQVHHTKYTARFPWEENPDNLVTLCFLCHERTHAKAA